MTTVDTSLLPAVSQPHSDDLSAPECIQTAHEQTGTHPQKTSVPEKVLFCGELAVLCMNQCSSEMFQLKYPASTPKHRTG